MKNRYITVMAIITLLISCEKRAKPLIPLSHWKLARANKSSSQNYVLVDITVKSDSITQDHRVALPMLHLEVFTGREYEKEHDTTLYQYNMCKREQASVDSLMDSLLLDGYYNGFTFTTPRTTRLFIEEEFCSEERYQELKESFDESDTITATQHFGDFLLFARYYIEQGALISTPCFGGVDPQPVFLSEEEIEEIIQKQQ